MNILFLTLSKIKDINQRGIYTDLVRELSSRGINVYITTPIQKREDEPAGIIDQGNVKILRVKTGNITATKSLVEKGISTLRIEGQYLRAIKRSFPGVEFDMIMYSTPPITFNRVIKHFKKKHNSQSYLLLKDIFPQNAVDIGLMKKDSILYKMFRSKEKELYRISDRIGCMSQGNVDYVLEHNKDISREKVEVFPNAIEPKEYMEKPRKDKDVLAKYGIPEDKVLFIYGGNLGKPQGIDFLLEVAQEFHRVKNGYLFIVGGGTEFNRIQQHVKNNKLENIGVYKKIPKEEYDKLISYADVGLVFLDHRFTIPNFPSRLTSYMENSLPVLAATDKNTDVKDILQESESGLWCESVHVDRFIGQAQKLSSSKDLRETMGLNGRKYLEENYDIGKTINTLLKHLDGDEEND